MKMYKDKRIFIYTQPKMSDKSFILVLYRTVKRCVLYLCSPYVLASSSLLGVLMGSIIM